jgi:addiction module RelE/StbE family toxin
MMWNVVESKKAQKQIKKCPKLIEAEYEAWKNVVEHSGPKALKSIPGYHDHALKGDWAGARSSYLNIQWRVIYFIDKKNIKIQVLEVNPHDYRKKS